MTRGKFIVFEGLDGSGKSTQAQLLYNHMMDAGADVVQACEPTDNAVGKLIRGVLTQKERLTQESLVYLFIADRLNHIEQELLPLLYSGVHVICDRYVHSNCAYQARYMRPEQILALNKPALARVTPDLIFYIDLPPHLCLERLQKSRASLEIFEKLDTLREIERNYQRAFELTPNIRCHSVDGQLRADDLSASIYSTVSELLAEE